MEEDSSPGLSLQKKFSDYLISARLWILLLLPLVGVVLALSLPDFSAQAGVVLEVNDVGTQDILAPLDHFYTSAVLTKIARDEAASAVEDEYDPPDGSIARQQVEQLRGVLVYIETLREDEYATNEQRLSDMAAIVDVRIDSITAQKLLDLQEVRWQVVRLETINVLGQVLRSEIREDESEEARRAIPALVGISLTEEQASLVVTLATPFVAPNSKFNLEATQTAREAARRNIASVVNTYFAGETIVSRGEVVSALHIEALQEFGLLKTPEPWSEVAIRTIFVGLLGSLFVLYMVKIHPDRLQDIRLLATFGILIVVAAFGLQLMIPGRTILPYIFPAALLPLILATLIGPGAGILIAVITGALAGFLASRGLELALYFMLSGSLAALVIGRAERLGTFFWAGFSAAMGAIAIVIVFRIPDPATDLIGKISLLAAAGVSGLLSASLGFGLLLLIGNLLGITTSLQLIELGRPDHPLQQMILRNSPGTYQHSLQVANLAEQAARAVKANALLTHVGALYHDAGKSLRPEYYIENQVPGHNVHEQLDPTTSAGVIIEHVRAGLELAQKYRLPKNIQAFIAEHHGTLQTSYQYQMALDTANGDESKVDRSDFQYPGPKPQSKETALLMLADGTEAKARAEAPKNKKEIDKIVRWVIENRLEQNQLDHVDLTLRDLDTIRRSFVSTLKGIYHSRIPYPLKESAQVLLQEDGLPSTSTPQVEET